LPTRRQWLGAARRFVLIVVALSVVIIAASLLIGGLAGASVARSLSLGFDLVGAFILLVGFFAGNRGPIRMKSETATAILGQRLIRWATPSEREDTLNLSAVLVTVGFVLILIGLALDPRYSLV
jgi:hypothetical protein